MLFSSFRSYATAVLSILVVAVMAAPALAQGKGEGAVVIRDGANIYRFSKGRGVEHGNLPYGFAVVGVTSLGPMESFQFEEENGRLHIKYLKLNDKGEQKSTPGRAFIDPADVERFSYPCGCEAGAEQNNKCSPFVTSGFADRSWNSCFREALDAKLAELKARPPSVINAALGSVPGKYLRKGHAKDYLAFGSDGVFSGGQPGNGFRGSYTVQGSTIIITSPQFPGREEKSQIIGNTIKDSDGIVWERIDTPPIPQQGTADQRTVRTAAAAPIAANEKALTNADVVSLVKVGLGDDLITAKIKSAPAVAFDVSTEGLVALKKGAVSNAVIDAIMKRATR